MEIRTIQHSIQQRNPVWKRHAAEKMVNRNISREDVKKVIQNGEIIEEYPDDSPFPSCLILGFIENRPIHTVVGFDSSSQMVYIITAYEPSTEKFESDFKTRKTNE